MRAHVNTIQATSQEDTMTTTHELLAALTPGSTVHVLQRHVSRSGMMRHLSLFLVRDGAMVDVTHAAAAVMGERVHDAYGGWTIKVGGCGMDMHFATVYGLSRRLFPNGHKCTGRTTEGRTIHRCPSNDHANDWGQLSRQFDLEHDADYSKRDASQEDREAYCVARAEWMDAQPNPYRKSRVHSDGGYALHHRSI